MKRRDFFGSLLTMGAAPAVASCAVEVGSDPVPTYAATDSELTYRLRETMVKCQAEAMWAEMHGKNDASVDLKAHADELRLALNLDPHMVSEEKYRFFAQLANDAIRDAEKTLNGMRT